MRVQSAAVVALALLPLCARGACMFGAPQVEGSCWFDANLRESCTAMCDRVGLVYDPRTEELTGSLAQGKAKYPTLSDTDVNSQMNQNCFAVLTQVSGVGANAQMDNGDLLACMVLGGGPFGAGCWRTEGNNAFALRCPTVDTYGAFVPPETNHFDARRSCACTAPVDTPTKRPPPPGMNWDAVQAELNAAECYFHQNAMWSPLQPDRCFCANGYSVNWNVWDTTDLLHGGVLCTKLPLDRDAAYGQLPACRPAGCGSTDAATCERCQKNFFGVVSGLSGDCKCFQANGDVRTVSGSADPENDRGYCSVKGYGSAELCSVDEPTCDDIQQNLDDCNASHSTCSADKGILSNQLDVAATNLTLCEADLANSVTVPELCCDSSTAALQQLITGLDNISNTIVQTDNISEEEYIVLDRMRRILYYLVDTVRMAQNPALI